MTYDSRPDTERHIDRVRELLAAVVGNLKVRAADHDRSKLVEPELSIFDEFTPKLRDTTYGSPEYKAFLAAMGEGLAHHYAANSHHPEHYPDGIRGMSLLDLIEMLCDWKAATERHADGDLARSIEQNQQRFGYSDELRAILTNTARELGLIGGVGVTASLAEATAAARRITEDGSYPPQWPSSKRRHAKDRDARLLAGFVLAGDTERLREALAFYADPETWDEDGRAWTNVGGVPSMEPDEDRGQIAREALAVGSP